LFVCLFVFGLRWLHDVAHRAPSHAVLAGDLIDVHGREIVFDFPDYLFA